MAHTWDELHGMNVAQLREIADGIKHKELEGYTMMHKDKLLPALCHALKIEDHRHHEVVGIDKGSVKAKIKELKVKRQAALESKDSAGLKRIRRQIHSLKRRIHAATT